MSLSQAEGFVRQVLNFVWYSLFLAHQTPLRTENDANGVFVHLEIQTHRLAEAEDGGKLGGVKYKILFHHQSSSIKPWPLCVQTLCKPEAEFKWAWPPCCLKRERKTTKKLLLPTFQTQPKAALWKNVSRDCFSLTFAFRLHVAVPVSRCPTPEKHLETLLSATLSLPKLPKYTFYKGIFQIFLEIITTSPGIRWEPWGYLMFKLETPSRNIKPATTWVSRQTLQGHCVASLLGVPSATCLNTCTWTCPLTWKWWATNCPISLSEHLTSQAAQTRIFTESKIQGLHGMDSRFLLDV